MKKLLSIILILGCFISADAKLTEVALIGDSEATFWLMDDYPYCAADSILNRGGMNLIGHGGETVRLDKKVVIYHFQYLVVEQKGFIPRVHKTSDKWLNSFESSNIEISKFREGNLNLFIGEVELDFTDISMEEFNFEYDSRSANYIDDTETKNNLSDIIESYSIYFLEKTGHMRHNVADNSYLTKANLDIFIKGDIDNSEFFKNSWKFDVTLQLKDSYGEEVFEDIVSCEIKTNFLQELIRFIEIQINDFIDKDELLSPVPIQEYLNEQERGTLKLDKNIEPNTSKDFSELVVTVLSEDGHGSGCIIDKSGIVITNHHVTVLADSLMIRTASGDTVRAELILSRPDLDLAVLRCDTTFERAFSLREDELLKLNDPILVVGTPVDLQFENTHSVGYISGFIRGIDYDSYQIGAAVNPGNSGSAMVDASGNLAGIVNAKLTGYGVRKFGFVIPIHHVINDLNILFE